ncbi:hypothetical protein F8388_023706 [Cannabis sativa]|uniref:Uncharacterized protein n=1 Tax=Cannabis sativa TaxID=3483 RepID=A0A7J6GC33_CANSA|nr:hypothetical protein F8388_023706 [Cannabis sativa]
MGSPASKKRVAINTDSPLNIIKRAAQNAIVIVAIDMKSVRSPITNFVGNDLRKSSSAYLDVSIPKNINTEAVDEKSEKASDIIKILNNFLCRKIGKAQGEDLFLLN